MSLSECLIILYSGEMDVEVVPNVSFELDRVGVTALIQNPVALFHPLLQIWELVNLCHLLQTSIASMRLGRDPGKTGGFGSSLMSSRLHNGGLTFTGFSMLDSLLCQPKECFLIEWCTPN